MANVTKEFKKILLIFDPEFSSHDFRVETGLK